jgi:membrane protein implicated in regulation of membrane protease activity
VVVVWILIGALLLAAEVVTIAFFALFGALGAFAAAIAAGAGAPVWAQLLVAAGVALLTMLAGRPPLRHLVSPYRSRIGPGTHPELVGRDALTLDQVGDASHPGHVLLGGERWLAITEQPDSLPPEVHVTVVEVRGTTLVVWP